MENKCLTQGVVYCAKITTDTSQETYTGVTKNAFKVRHRGHCSSFKKAKYKNSTKLSEHVWNLKSSRNKYKIKWSILGKAKHYNPGSKECNLCNMERYYIIMKPEHSSLNKQDEMTNICVHKKQALLMNVDKPKNRKKRAGYPRKR